MSLIPSPSASPGFPVVELGLYSSLSRIPSPSKSPSASTGRGSQVSGIPSSSVSGSNGLEPSDISSVSFRPSPSSSGSASLPIPSPSVSNHSLESSGKASTATQTSTIVTGPSQ